MARIFWPFPTLESVLLVVRTVAALYIFSMTAATSSILAVGCARSLMVVGRRTYRWTMSGQRTRLALLFVFRNNSMNALDLARVQV
jgi:hypothetical protein